MLEPVVNLLGRAQDTLDGARSQEEMGQEKTKIQKICEIKWESYRYF
jgi:hypothetical protein